jgi:hypothetical protein
MYIHIYIYTDIFILVYDICKYKNKKTTPVAEKKLSLLNPNLQMPQTQCLGQREAAKAASPKSCDFLLENKAWCPPTHQRLQKITNHFRNLESGENCGKQMGTK